MSRVHTVAALDYRATHGPLLEVIFFFESRVVRICIT